ncbi:hypothetical protein Ahy_A03g016027 [Arachis hypogaea]|uniref:Uncharacterized protein n=1 Tax=Arachis hypogaea TaxID=3818 RepID=A0A445E225_ARAHY|nr:hypothetical protein Ahy_A03g016027 [Arachis hypogaea]
MIQSNKKEYPIVRYGSFQMLEVAYFLHLRAQLKRCFTYCSIFSKGYEIKKWNLIYLRVN